MVNMLINTLVSIVLFGTFIQSPNSGAGQLQHTVAEKAAFLENPTEPSSWFWLTSDERRESVAPPTKLAIIACRTESRSRQDGTAPGDVGPDWRLPVECMRIIETVTDSAALNNFWLRQMTPNLADYGTCAEVSMAYAPQWEAAHKNWVIVKVGCPTKLLDADGNVVGWHMPECQGTLPGTSYPLRCRFNLDEI